MPVQIDLHYVDELINVRRGQHGGGRGAPPIVNGYREGESINRSCIVMLSALLQAYVEEVFLLIASEKLPHITNEEKMKKFKETIKRWGNPSGENINSLFARLGEHEIMSGLAWQRMPNASVKKKLKELNEVRNDIAHGRLDIRTNGAPYLLTLARVRNFREFSANFAQRFEAHARGRLN